MILVEEVVYNQKLNDAHLASLSVLSYSRWRPRWRLCIKTCVFSQVYVRVYIVIHVFGCVRSQLIHLEMFQSNQGPFSASKLDINTIGCIIATHVKPTIKNVCTFCIIGKFELLLYIIYCNSYFSKVIMVDTLSLES